jgi:hypothetical protein
MIFEACVHLLIFEPKIGLVWLESVDPTPPSLFFYATGLRFINFCVLRLGTNVACLIFEPTTCVLVYAILGETVALRELTARQDRCLDQLTCPGVFEKQGAGRVVIVGAMLLPQEFAGRVGKSEAAVEIDRGLLTRAIGGPVSRLFMRFGL